MKWFLRSDKEIRLECVRLAPNGNIGLARQIYDFVQGNDSHGEVRLNKLHAKETVTKWRTE